MELGIKVPKALFSWKKTSVFAKDIHIIFSYNYR